MISEEDLKKCFDNVCESVAKLADLADVVIHVDNDSGTPSVGGVIMNRTPKPSTWEAAQACLLHQCVAMPGVGMPPSHNSTMRDRVKSKELVGQTNSPGSGSRAKMMRDRFFSWCVVAVLLYLPIRAVLSIDRRQPAFLIGSPAVAMSHKHGCCFGRVATLRPARLHSPPSQRKTALKVLDSWSDILLVGALVGAAAFGFSQQSSSDSDGVATDLEARFVDKLKEKSIGEGDAPALEAELASLATEFAALQQPFQADRLGGGRWVVAWSRGDLVWQQWAQALPKLSQGRPNQSSQTYDVSQLSLVNEAQILGDSLAVRVKGTFEDPPQGARCPVQFDAFVDGGVLQIAGGTVPLPIKGTGTVTVVYAGERVRIFQSSGDSGYEDSKALTVQVPVAEWESIYVES